MRGSDGEFGRYVSIAMGSASEVEYHIVLARDLGYLVPEVHAEPEQRIIEIKRMLSSLAKTLRKKS